MSGPRVTTASHDGNGGGDRRSSRDPQNGPPGLQSRRDPQRDPAARAAPECPDRRRRWRGRRHHRRLSPGPARRARRTAGRAGGADGGLDLPLGRSRRPAARRPHADPDEHVRRRAVPAAPGRRPAAGLGRERQHQARLERGAAGGDPPAGRLGTHVRPAAGGDLPPRGRRAVPAGGSRRRDRRVLPAVGRAARPLAAHLRAGGRRPRGRRPDLHPHPRARDRHPRGPARAARAEGAHRPRRRRVRGGRRLRRDVRGRDRAVGGRAAADRADVAPVRGHRGDARGGRGRPRWALRSPAQPARPRPARVLPAGGRRPGRRRLRARPGAVHRDERQVRRDPGRLQRPAAARRLGPPGGDLRERAAPGARARRDRDPAGGQRAGGLHPRQRVLPGRDRGGRTVRGGGLLRARHRRRGRHRQGGGRVDRRRGPGVRRVAHGHPPVRPGLPLALVHPRADRGDVRHLLRHRLPRPAAVLGAAAAHVPRVRLARRARGGVRREGRLGTRRALRPRPRADQGSRGDLGVQDPPSFLDQRRGRARGAPAAGMGGAGLVGVAGRRAPRDPGVGGAVRRVVVRQARGPGPPCRRLPGAGVRQPGRARRRRRHVHPVPERPRRDRDGRHRHPAGGRPLQDRHRHGLGQRGPGVAAAAGARRAGRRRRRRRQRGRGLLRALGAALARGAGAASRPRTCPTPPSPS